MRSALQWDVCVLKNLRQGDEDRDEGNWCWKPFKQDVRKNRTTDDSGTDSGNIELINRRIFLSSLSPGEIKVGRF